MFPRAPRLVSFPCFSTAPSRFLSSFPRKLRGNQLVWAQNQPNRQNTGYFAGIPGKPRVYLENTRYFAGFLGFASDFAPDQLSDSGKLESCQNGAPNTLWFPWKFPETQSAGDPLVSFLVSGNMDTGQGEGGRVHGAKCLGRPPHGGSRPTSCASARGPGSPRQVAQIR